MSSQQNPGPAQINDDVPDSYSQQPPFQDAAPKHPDLQDLPFAAPNVEMQPWVRRLGGFVSRVTYGTLRVDLTRPTWHMNQIQSRGRGSQACGTYNVYGQPVHQRVANMSVSTDRMSLEQPQGLIHGARVKIMRGAAVGPVVPIPGSSRRAVDAALGVNLDLAGSGLRPVMRLKLISALRLYLAPQPVLKLKHSFPIFNTGLCLHAVYMQPLRGASLRNVGKSGAWNIALGRTGENEIIVSPDRIELSNQRLQLGDNMCLHVSGEVNYPRYLPNPAWSDQFSFLPSRVSVQAGW